MALSSVDSAADQSEIPALATTAKRDPEMGVRQHSYRLTDSLREGSDDLLMSSEPSSDDAVTSASSFLYDAESAASRWKAANWTPGWASRSELVSASTSSWEVEP